MDKEYFKKIYDYWYNTAVIKESIKISSNRDRAFLHGYNGKKCIYNRNTILYWVYKAGKDRKKVSKNIEYIKKIITSKCKDNIYKPLDIKYKQKFATICMEDTSKFLTQYGITDYFISTSYNPDNNVIKHIMILFD